MVQLQKFSHEGCPEGSACAYALIIQSEGEPDRLLALAGDPTAKVPGDIRPDQNGVRERCGDIGFSIENVFQFFLETIERDHEQQAHSKLKEVLSLFFPTAKPISEAGEASPN